MVVNVLAVCEFCFISKRVPRVHLHAKRSSVAHHCARLVWLRAFFCVKIKSFILLTYDGVMANFALKDISRRIQ